MTAHADPTDSARIRPVNSRPLHSGGDYVLYWIQMYRRLDHNHALNHALQCAERLRKPLVIYEGLKLAYPWASRRLHRFVLDGMCENRRAAGARGFNYWPFVETPDQSGRGLVRRLAERACLVVTDDYPAFIVPGQTAALAAKTDVAVVAVDSNGLVPLEQLGEPVKAAAHLRPRVHRAFADAWAARAGLPPEPSRAVRCTVEPPFEPWDAEDVGAFVAGLPLDATVPEVPGVTGGTTAARARLQHFVRYKLSAYAESRSAPAPPDDCPASGLSPYLHFGHLSLEEVAAAVLNARGEWSPEDIHLACRGRREGFFCTDPAVNAFLDEAVVWRDVGYHWHRARGADAVSLERALPPWAWATLNRHRADRRAHVYTPEQFEAGETHDELWNAAQRELVATGTIHNYLRMLWGKKVLEWSATPEEAYRTLEHLNNKYALDGRDPNSYSGILWCFGLFDRPWPPERPVFGTVRYMSSENTARKFNVRRYLEYVKGLPAIAEVVRGR